MTEAWIAVARDWGARWMEVLRAPAVGPDLLAGLTVAAVALPLNVALAVASGLPPATSAHRPLGLIIVTSRWSAWGILPP